MVLVVDVEVLTGPVVTVDIFVQLSTIYVTSNLSSSRSKYRTEMVNDLHT